VFSSIAVPSDDDVDLDLSSITAGPDGALWFTSGGTVDAIGRVTLDGGFDRWPVPWSTSSPQQIVTGSDGALWFTDSQGSRIGRITTGGELSEFPVPAGKAPSAIARGADGALWFTTATDLGRIDVRGTLAMLPVPGAERLGDIVADPDGSFWITDGPRDRVWHVVPPGPRG
jgi:virginiamycin B lyase